MYLKKKVGGNFFQTIIIKLVTDPMRSLIVLSFKGGRGKKFYDNDQRKRSAQSAFFIINTAMISALCVVFDCYDNDSLCVVFDCCNDD